MPITIMFDPEPIVMQAASTEPDSKVIEALMADVLSLAHAGESAVRMGSAEPALGWNIYIMSVDMEMARQLVQLPESGILDAKGSSLGKFVSWLNSQEKARDAADRVHSNLLSDLKSSRYGLF